MTPDASIVRSPLIALRLIAPAMESVASSITRCVVPAECSNEKSPVSVLPRMSSVTSVAEMATEVGSTLMRNVLVVLTPGRFRARVPPRSAVRPAAPIVKVPVPLVKATGGGPRALVPSAVPPKPSSTLLAVISRPSPCLAKEKSPVSEAPSTSTRMPVAVSDAYGVVPLAVWSAANLTITSLLVPSMRSVSSIAWVKLFTRTWTWPERPTPCAPGMPTIWTRPRASSAHLPSLGADQADGRVGDHQAARERVRLAVGQRQRTLAEEQRQAGAGERLDLRRAVGERAGLERARALDDHDAGDVELEVGHRERERVALAGAEGDGERAAADVHRLVDGGAGGVHAEERAGVELHAAVR